MIISHSVFKFLSAFPCPTSMCDHNCHFCVSYLLSIPDFLEYSQHCLRDEYMLIKKQSLGNKQSVHCLFLVAVCPNSVSCRGLGWPV